MVLALELGFVGERCGGQVGDDCWLAGSRSCEDGMTPLLFLSHAGADSARALALADAIEASPEAQKAELKVWLDQRLQGPNRLIGGTPWQEQLEAAIVQHSTAFGLLLTREGARNWVRLELRVALDRVIAAHRIGGGYPFIPIIADDINDVDALPPCDRQYQGV